MTPVTSTSTRRRLTMGAVAAAAVIGVSLFGAAPAYAADGTLTVVNNCGREIRPTIANVNSNINFAGVIGTGQAQDYNLLPGESYRAVTPSGDRVYAITSGWAKTLYAC